MQPALSELACPKCASPLRPQERQGVIIDVCQGCRGIFLDRGELDRLLDMESAVAPPILSRHDAASPLPGRYDDARDRRDGGDRFYPRGDEDRRYGRDDDWDDDDDRPRRRRGFLADLFDGLGD